MSRDAQQPRGADRPRGAFETPDRETDRPAGRPGHRPTDRGGSRSLFDLADDLTGTGEPGGRSPDLDVFGPDRRSEVPAPTPPRRDTGRVFGGPILGAGPEVARGPRREPTGRHELIRTGQFAPVSTLPSLEPSPLERMVDSAHRWRSPLGLVLAAMITVGVVVGYQRWTAGDEIAATGIGGESRSASTSTTDPDEGAEDTSDDPASERLVDSEVDESDSTTPSTVQPDSGSPTTAAAASPTTAPSSTSAASASTTPTTASSTVDSQTSIPPADSSTSQPPSTADPDPGPSISQPSATSTSTTAAPGSSTTTSPAPAPVRTEAEAATPVGGATVATAQPGFSGTGYVTGLDAVGDGVSFTVDSVGGMVPFAIGYSAGPVDGAPQLRTASILVDGERKTSAQMDATPTFGDWTIVAGTLELPAGRSVITIEIQTGDSGQINIDYIEVG